MLELNQVYKRFDDVVVLKDLTVTIPEGATWGIFGSNGAGKSTLLYLLAGVYPPDRGTVRLDGAELSEDVTQRASVLLVPERPYHTRGATLHDMSEMYRYYYRAWDQARFNQLRDVFGITLKKPLDRMSQGVQRQAGVMLALAVRPKVLILDEVPDHLDALMRREISRILDAESRATGLTVIMVSHLLGELEATCDRLTLLHDGRLIPADALHRLESGLRKFQVIFAEPPEPSVWDQAGLKPRGLRVDGHAVTFLTDQAPEAVAAAAAPFAPTYITEQALTLEERFREDLRYIRADAEEEPIV